MYNVSGKGSTGGTKISANIGFGKHWRMALALTILLGHCITPTSPLSLSFPVNERREGGAGGLVLPVYRYPCIFTPSCFFLLLLLSYALYLHIFCSLRAVDHKFFKVRRECLR